MKHAGGRPRNLTPIEEIEVYNMHKQGKPIAEIAYKFGISPSTVNRTVKRLNEKGEEKNNEK